MTRKFRLAAIVICLCSVSLSAFGQDDDINHDELNWFTIETPHFYVHFHNGEERTAQVVARVAEDIYGPVTSFYHHEPDQKVSIVMVDYDDYSNGESFFYDNKIEIWAPALDFDLRGTHDWLRNVVTHEFTHIVQIQTSMKFGRRIPGFYVQWLNYESERRQDVLYGYPNVIVSYPISGFDIPSWFAEGVAQFNRHELRYDRWDSHRDMILRMYALTNKMLTWNEMSVFEKTSLGNESSYNAGFSIVRYIYETYGPNALEKISRKLTGLDVLTIDTAIKRALGISGEQLYADWKAYVTSEYKRRTEPVYHHRVEGETIASEGFGNFYPEFSPDGRKIAYTSTKDADYFGLASVYVYDLDTKKERKIADHVYSSLSWSPDGKKIYYAKLTQDNPHWSSYSDIYECNVETGKETRLTYAMRAHNPSVSPDGKEIVFAGGSDGTLNVEVVDSLGKNFRRLTDFNTGEQVFTPKWSPDGKYIVFGYSLKEAQDVDRVSADGGNVETLVGGDDDSRNPVYAPDGKTIFFVSDRTGIFNIYRYDTEAKTISQVSNVLGGAFMPTVNSQGEVAFSSYTSGGFKINFLKSSSPQDFKDATYLPGQPFKFATTDSLYGIKDFDWTKLHAYNDTSFTWQPVKPYKNIFTSLSFIPFLRIDNYNTKNKGFDFLKPGLYVTSSDVLGRYDLFAGAAFNRLLERDLFLTFDYHDRIIGLHQLGLDPTVSFQVYNITRNSSGDIQLGLQSESLDVTYGLLEFDLFLRQPLFSAADELTLGITHSRYSADIGAFTVPGDSITAPYTVPGSSDLYFTGTDLSAEWNFDGIAPSLNSDINPVGRKIMLRYDYEINNFNSSGEYEETESGPTPVLSPFDFHRAEIKYSEFIPLPGWKHTLSVTLHGGTIFGPQVPDFFDFYAGGLPGMRGYSFYDLGGNEMATANVTYRFPIWENIDFRFLQLYFDKLYGSFDGDYGNAWDGNADIKSFKRDAGFELRLEGSSYYAYPTRIFFNGTYGFDSFAVPQTGQTVGKEWRFYFGILFDFDLDSDLGLRH
jgi:Tol biopolymer transport system component